MIEKVPKPSAESFSLAKFLVFPGTMKYSTAPFTPASISIAFISLKIVIPTLVVYQNN